MHDLTQIKARIEEIQAGQQAPATEPEMTDEELLEGLAKLLADSH